MTTILLCLAALLMLVGALYALLCQPLVAALWYRLMHDPDPYAPEFAAAPRFDREPRCRVVAGSDLDRHRRPIDEVNAAFSALLDADPNLATLRDLDLSAYYVLPEGDR